MKTKAKKPTKPTHSITFHQNWRARWNWRVTAANGEQICHSNQGHENKGDAEGAARNFLKAARAGRVLVEEAKS